MPYFQRNMASAVDKHQYRKTIELVNGAQQKLGPSNYELHKPLNKIMWVHADSFQLMNRTKQMLQDLSHTFDGLLQKHLNSVSHVYTSYLSALIQQLRVKINKDNGESKNRVLSCKGYRIP